MIKKLKIKNFKCFLDWFSIDFEKGINILVGNNGSGKSTILEAINLALTGRYHGRNIRNELSQYLFNKDVVNQYFLDIKEGKIVEPPEVIIEVYFSETTPNFLGDDNSDREKDTSGVVLSINFDKRYSAEYELLLEEEVSSIPIEYYEVNWRSFARENITSRGVPIKTAMIDTTSYTPVSGSDIYISRIVRNILDENEIIHVSQAHRMMKDLFSKSSSITNINKKLSETSNKSLALSVDFGNKNSWETSLITELDGIPYNNIGKGSQCILKTQLALSDKKLENKQVLLFEEPECHLSYSNLNILLDCLNVSNDEKQMIITTHSSFVLNKLGLENLILLSNQKTLRLRELSKDTSKYFKKVAGYDTLRLVLAKKVILVEGDSDELIVQRAYMQFNKGKLPIYDGIDVISVGTSFLRFLEISQLLGLQVTVVTDNDGNIDAINNKYKDYIDDEKIHIFYDEEVHEYKGSLKNYNYNTLEPCIYRANSLSVLNDVLQTSYETEDALLGYMKKNKTEVALKIFESEREIRFPKYIEKAISI